MACFWQYLFHLGPPWSLPRVQWSQRPSQCDIPARAHWDQIPRGQDTPSPAGLSHPHQSLTEASPLGPTRRGKKKQKQNKFNIFFHYKYSWTFLGPSLRGAFAYPGQGFGFDIFTGFPGKHSQILMNIIQTIWPAVCSLLQLDWI